MSIKMLKNPKNRTLVLVAGLILVVGIVVAILNIGKSDSSIDQKRSQLSSIPRGVESTPGGKATTKYSKLLEKENLRRAAEAEKRGESFIATIGGRVSEGSLGLTTQAEADLRQSLLLRYPELKDLLDKYPDLYVLLNQHPELSKLFNKECKKLTDPDLLTSLQDVANALSKNCYDPGGAPETIEQMIKRYPQLKAILKKHPELTKVLQEHPGLASILVQNPGIEKILSDHPEIAGMVAEDSSLAAKLIRDPNLAIKLADLMKDPQMAKILAENPSLAKVMLDNPKLAKIIGANPELARAIAANPDLAKQLISDPNMAQKIATLLKQYPELTDLIAEDPTLVTKLMADPTLAAKLSKAAKSGSKYSADPVMAELIKQNPGLENLLVKNSKLEALLREHPELASLLIDNPQLADILQKNPDLFTAAMSDPDLVKQLSNDKNLVRELSRDPSLVKTILGNPSVISMLRKNPELIPLIRKNPKLADLLVGNPKLGSILAKNPSLAGQIMQDRNYAKYLESGEIPLSLQDTIRSTIAEESLNKNKLNQEESDQMKNLNEAKLKAIQQVVTAMEKQSNAAVKSWATVVSQKYVEGRYSAAVFANLDSPLNDLLEQSGGGSNPNDSDSKNGANNKSTRNKNKNNEPKEEAEVILKAGHILFAVLETAVNSDEPGPILAKIVQGPLKGSRVIGKMTPPSNHQEKLLLTFEKLNIPEAPFTIQLNAVAIDPDSARTAIASDVDHHYFLKYGSLFAAKFIEGYSKAVSESGTTSNSVASPTGGNNTTTTRGKLSGRQQLFEGLGEVGKAWGNSMGDNISRKPTITINQGVGIGLLVLSDIKKGIPAEDVQQYKASITIGEQNSTDGSFPGSTPKQVLSSLTSKALQQQGSTNNGG